MAKILGFREMLRERQIVTGSLLCVGLDPLPEKVPECIGRGQLWSRVLIQMREIVDATAPYACMFKPQKAHYEAIPDGQKTLQGLVDYIHYKYPDIPVFLDCKRGDIDRTQQRYQIAQFEIDGVDGMNFSPYMGKECEENLINKEHPERALVGLCYTSNKSAREVQDAIMEDGRPYWQFMAERILEWSRQFGVMDNAGLVMAAAYEQVKGSGEVYSKHLSECRKIVGDWLWFLIPGVGTQQGFVEQTIMAAFVGFGSMAINSSSGITFKSIGNDFAEAASKEAKRLCEEMQIDIIKKVLGQARSAKVRVRAHKSLAKEEITNIFAKMQAIYTDDHFVYTKGGHGNAYVNKDDIYKDSASLSELCRDIAYRACDLRVQVVCGPTFGGALIANRVAEWLEFYTGETVIAVVVDAEGDTRVIKRGYGKHVKGKRVLITEDILNTGGTASETVKAVRQANGIPVALKAFCNRAIDKEAVRQLIGLEDQESLIEVTMDNQSAETCSYCSEGRPINQELGHGRAFLVKIADTDPEKATRLGWRGCQ